MCIEYVILQAEALRQYPDVVELRTVSVVMSASLSNNDDGQYNYKTNTITINQNMCDRTKEEQDYLVAHELGHLVAFKYYKLLHNEDLANIYGSHIYPTQNKEKLALLFEKQCSLGYYNQCGKAKSWRYAMVR